MDAKGRWQDTVNETCINMAFCLFKVIINRLHLVYTTVRYSQSCHGVRSLCRRESVEVVGFRERSCRLGSVSVEGMSLYGIGRRIRVFPNEYTG